MTNFSADYFGNLANEFSSAEKLCQFEEVGEDLRAKVLTLTYINDGTAKLYSAANGLALLLMLGAHKHVESLIDGLAKDLEQLRAQLLLMDIIKAKDDVFYAGAIFFQARSLAQGAEAVASLVESIESLFEGQRKCQSARAARNWLADDSRPRKQCAQVKKTFEDNRGGLLPSKFYRGELLEISDSQDDSVRVWNRGLTTHFTRSEFEENFQIVEI